MASQCLGRRTNERLLFGDGKHYFYTEERCKRKTAGGLCSVCDGGAALEHGIVSEGIPPLSHIYGSAWYDLKRTVYGNPSSQDMAKAKKAQEVSSPVISPVTSSAETASPTKPVKKRTFKVAATATEVAAAALTEMAAPVAAPVKAKRQPKKVVQAQPQEIQPLATESTEPPLQDLPCITISVRKIDHNGRKYYLNSEKDKLYTVQPDGGVGKYCGRLDRENDRIADFPDSDSER